MPGHSSPFQDRISTSIALGQSVQGGILQDSIAFSTEACVASLKTESLVVGGAEKMHCCGAVVFTHRGFHSLEPARSVTCSAAPQASYCSREESHQPQLCCHRSPQPSQRKAYTLKIKARQRIIVHNQKIKILT